MSIEQVLSKETWFEDALVGKCLGSCELKVVWCCRRPGRVKSRVKKCEELLVKKCERWPWSFWGLCDGFCYASSKLWHGSLTDGWNALWKAWPCWKSLKGLCNRFYSTTSKLETWVITKYWEESTVKKSIVKTVGKVIWEFFRLVPRFLFQCSPVSSSETLRYCGIA